MNVCASFAGLGYTDWLSASCVLQTRPLPQIPPPGRTRMCGKELGKRVSHPSPLIPPIHTGGGLSQQLCCEQRAATTGNKYLNQTPVKVIQPMTSFCFIVVGLPVRSVTRCLSIISETLNRKHWLANGQGRFRSDRGSIKDLPCSICSCSYCIFLTGWDCRRGIKEGGGVTVGQTGVFIFVPWGGRGRGQAIFFCFF